MTDKNSCVAIYKTHTEAEEAVKELSHAGFDVKKLSIVGMGYHTEENVAGYYTTGDRVKFWGAQGAFWGGLWGLLLGSAFLWVPGVGPLVMGGPIVAALVGALEGAALTGSLTALGAALFSIGVPKDSILKYETALKADKYLLIVHGTREEVERAAELLRVNKEADVSTHNS